MNLITVAIMRTQALIAQLVVAVLTGVISCSRVSQDSVDEWIVGTSTGMLDDWTQEEFDNLVANGIRYVELGVGPLVRMSDDSVSAWVEDVRQKAENAGVEVWSVHLPYGRTLDVSTMNEEDRQNTIETHMRLMRLLAPLNVQKYVVHGSAEPIEDAERQERIQNSINSLKLLTEEVKKYGAELAMEVLPRTCLGNTSDEVIHIVDSVGGGLRVCFDSNHALQEKPEEFVRKVGSRIATIHVADYDGVDEKHWIPGRGVNDWNEIIAALEETGYQGPWMYEVVRRPTDDPPVTVADLGQNWTDLKTTYLENR